MLTGGPVVNPAPCPTGFYCPSGTSAAMSFPCPAGTFGPDQYYTAIENCTDCPAGSYCERDGLDTPSGECWAGYYCTGGASSPTPISHNVNYTDNTTFTGNDGCPMGYYCTNGTAYPLPCPIGTFSTQLKVTTPDDCEPCPKGRYCNVQAFTKVTQAPLCDAGYVCTGGSSTATPTNTSEGFLCPPGHFCVQGAEFAEGCPIGTYQPNYGQDSCTVCPAGYMCQDVNMTAPEPCMEGYYCPYNSTPQGCPAGTFNNKTGMDDASQCTDCPPGYYCLGIGNVNPSGQCDGGYFCQGGATSTIPTPTATYPDNGPCIPGYYCPTGTTAMIPCPAGTIRNNTGGSTLDDCLPCPGGYYCAFDGQTQASGECSAGYFCPSNATITSPNPSGYECPIGHYCLQGSTAATPCLAGQTQLNTGQSSCDDCPAGYYCQSAVNPNPEDCPPYKYCPAGTATPKQCANGTYTYDNTTNLEKQDDCLPCVAGQFCRDGQLAGNCSAGYYCKSGSLEDMPNATYDFSSCAADSECAGPCPPGSYCPIGTETPVPCPADTYRDVVGAEQDTDCGPCPAGSLCPEGTANPQPCPVGHYCPQGNGTYECPRLTFRNITGAAVITDCFPCEAGYWCNYTGMADYSNSLCPPGYFCLSGDEPRLCPAGRRRDTPGAVDAYDCPRCRPGYYCPNDTENTQGIPCRETYECPRGASIEIDCRPGHYCNGTTGYPPLCWPGYYCPNATDTPILCLFPDYCPEGSNMTLSCPLGYKAEAHPGVRYDINMSCTMCPPGYYGNSTDRSTCEVCPAGYYCPAGTAHGTDNPCPIGSYCPEGSYQPTPCPVGMYGRTLLATDYSECHLCDEDTFNDLEGQTYCRPCGSSSSAPPGSALCTCKGLFRSFQPSYGACVCETGYVYYDEVDSKKQDGNSPQDCQQVVDSRCARSETRMAHSRSCVNPDSVDCSDECAYSGSGSLDIALGRCVCSSYTDPEQICDASCRATTEASVELELNSDGTVSLTVTDPATGTITTSTMPDIVGPSETTVGPTTFVVLNFYGDTITASVFPTAADAINEIQYDLNTLQATPVVGRRRLLTTTVPSNQVPNPALCLEQNQMVLFKVSINTTDRASSNYPVYVVNHLYNSNPTFDYGAFTQLAYLIANTNVSISSFAHVFTEAGTYVFQDAQDSTLDVVIEVKSSGSSCPTSSSVLTSSAGNLALLGVYKQDVANEEPDWGLIVGLLAFFGACVVLLVVAVIVWKPRDSIIYPMKRWKPRYRSLGMPPPVPSYIRYDVDNWPDKISDTDSLGPRPAADGAESDVLVAMGKNESQELENFNVRVFYDKLEDQNLHLAAQLSRQKEDLDDFYNRISAQNDELRKLLHDLDPAKLEALEQREAAIERDGLQGAAVDGEGGPTIINASLIMGGAGGRRKYANAVSREAELMAALKLLLDRLNTGNIPLSKEMWEKLQKEPPAGGAGSSSVNVFNMGGVGAGTQTAAQGELLRQQNGEKMQLERELARAEQEAFDSTLKDLDDNRRRTVDTMMDSLALKLQGDLKDSELQQILSQHEKDLEGFLNKHGANRERQLEELRRRLAEKRRNREEQLRKKHSAESEQAGLPPPPEGADTTDITLRTEQGLLTAVHHEEAAGQSRAESESSHNMADQLRKDMSSSLTSQIEGLGGQNLLPDDKVRDLVKQQREREKELANKMERHRESQLDHLNSKLAKRRQNKMSDLQQRQEQERADLSSQLIRDGFGNDRDFILHNLDLQHQQQRQATTAELDADEAEQRRQLSQALDEDHTNSLQNIHNDISKEMEASIPEKDRLAAQRLIDQHRRDLESHTHDLESEKNRQLADLQAKLSARHQRRLQEAARQMEEEAARRFVFEQTRQLAQGGGDSDTSDVGADLQHKPSVNYTQSSEERAMLKEQDRTKEDMKKRHKQERDSLSTKLDQEAQREEAALNKQADSEMQQLLREKKNKNAAEQAARSDLSQEQLAELMARHQQELDDLQDKLESEKSRQMLSLRDRLAKNRRRRMEDLRRKQDAELTNEMLEQRKELDEVRLKQAKEVERAAIEEGIRENGTEDSDKVVQAVLAARHAQELRDLEAAYQAKRRMMVDEALNKLHAEYDKQRADLLKRHQEELAALQKQALSPEEMAERRAALLNRQQIELSNLDQRLQEDEGQVQRTAAADWEVAFARDKLALKERHYKEFADALREYNPQHEGVSSAEGAADDLEKVKAELEQRRREKEQQLKKEQEEFEKSEEKRLEAEMSAYAQELEDETKKEKEKHDRNIEALNKRKEELLEENKKRLQEEMERLKAAGASQEEQDALLKQHQHNTNSLVSKLEADRLRMQSGLQDRLKKRRQEKMQQKEQDLKQDADHQLRQMENYQQKELERLKMDESLTLQEALNVDRLATKEGMGAPGAFSDTRGPPAQPTATEQSVPSSQEGSMPASFTQAAPLNEAELLALLMASPLYQKLEKVKKAVAEGALQNAPTSSDGHLDARDSQWTGDKDLSPLDVNSLDVRSFVIYKFGSFIAGMVAARCHHAPVTILLADRIPANPHLTRNLYRNSFHFDANNRILYVRAARLDSVGEFVLVLVHCLAHIKSGDLRDDTKPAFVQEYQRALAVVCDSLFFAHHGRPSNTLQSVAAAMGTDTRSAGQALQSVFGRCPSEDARTRVVEDLLDLKVLPEVDAYGRQFSADRVQERLSKYGNFSATNKLQSMLGSLEDKVRQAGAQGSSREVSQELSALSQRYSTAGTTVLTRQVAPSFSMANLSGHALWQTFANRLGSEPEESTSSADLSTPSQDDYDDLCSDFARVCQQQISVRDAIRTHEQDITSEMELRERSKGSEQEVHARKLQEATEHLQAAKAQLDTLTAQRSHIEQLLEKSAVAESTPKPVKESATAASSEKQKTTKPGRKEGKSKK